ncbi:SCO1/SenC domain-containing protein [Ditylenchus destructor]|uniref:SCO1/SenC domain-containing protein n=1 Tax=Ditylenchus destructor TaxID=166010 RepID=A0AAD4MTI0_9BILA|nr:SCO1/SenC domain-containing protein [Ditylenchus destructor]
MIVISRGSFQEWNAKRFNSTQSGGNNSAQQQPERKHKVEEYTQRRQSPSSIPPPTFTWKAVVAALTCMGISVAFLASYRKDRDKETETKKKYTMGKSLIGGEWEAINAEGKLQGTKDFLGKWLILYFGFTNCPDICPEQLEKLIAVTNTIDEDRKSGLTIPLVPVFISVDPERDTPSRVKKYCEEFSPKLKGFTGDKEQVQKISKTFRIYFSQGPKTSDDDYIMDHTIVMYLINPDGEFTDYFTQTKGINEIVEGIRSHVVKYEMIKRAQK